MNKKFEVYKFKKFEAENLGGQNLFLKENYGSERQIKKSRDVKAIDSITRSMDLRETESNNHLRVACQEVLQKPNDIKSDKVSISQFQEIIVDSNDEIEKRDVAIGKIDDVKGCLINAYDELKENLDQNSFEWKLDQFFLENLPKDIFRC